MIENIHCILASAYSRQSYKSPINLFAAQSTHVVLIDCDYTGRHYQDTSMFKALMVHKDMTTFTSFS
ncbi:hypothetical protein THRCLA_21320 [Thraustotheca clavata]|uniref:Uncharacterized protein n=1 Tax=Thraustotheca clavata TaxID=74557 RepID=A0A1V9ZXQ6_9STRA|nr:hypothetical protein THRCLA_21320 [Thraustotheca clavata]